MTSTSRTEAPVELVPATSARARQASRRQRVLLFSVALIIVHLILIVQLLSLGAITVDTLLDASAWQAIFEKMWEALLTKYQSPSDKVTVFFIVALTPIAIIIYWAIGKPSLIIDSNGIRKTGARLDRFLNWELNWSIRRADIATIDFRDSLVVSNWCELVITTTTGESRTLRPKQWVRRGSLGQFFISRGEQLFASSGAVRKHNTNTALVKALQQFEYGIEVPAISEDVLASFDLVKNPTTAQSVIVIFALLAIAAFGALASAEQYVAGYPDILFAIIGILLGATIGIVNLFRDVPWKIALGIAVVGFIAGSAASFPALLHLNAYLDQAGLQSVHYSHRGNYEYRAVSDNWPDIKLPGKFRSHRENLDEPITIAIRRGGLGFYQADFRGLDP